MDNWNPWGGLEERQRKHEARLTWLRGLKTSDEVMLTLDGAGLSKTTERATVTRHPSNGALYVSGHPRRDLRNGKWHRGGRLWLELRIDPVGESEGQR